MHLLNAGIASQVTGIELSADTVSSSLKVDRRFTLIEGDVTKIELNNRFDVCIYGAVHHHVLNHYGIGMAISVLQRLASSCNKALFFETGQLTEGSRWEWQRAMYRYFRTDEEHLHYLLRSIEHLIEDFQVLGRFWIHGVRRWYLKIDLVAPEKRKFETYPAERIAIRNGPTEAFGRKFRSSDQKLVSLDATESQDSPTWYGIAEGIDGQKLFLKRHVHSPAAGLREYKIGRQTPHLWAVQCAGFSDSTPTLVFPLIEKFRNVTSFASESSWNRRIVADKLLQVFDDARNSLINIEERLLLPGVGKKSMLQLCDFNPNNLLVVNNDDSMYIRVVDFEQQSCRYSWRNRLHLSHMLLNLRHHRIRASMEFLLGILGMLRLVVQYQFLPLERRVRDRQPALLSVVVTEIRRRTGKLTSRVLNTIGYE